MFEVDRMHQRLESGLLRTARAAQAVVIGSFDRVAAVGPVRWAIDAQLEILERVVPEPADTVDSQYRLVANLLDLHREFAQRLFDVVDHVADEVPEISREMAHIVRIHG